MGLTLNRFPPSVVGFPFNAVVWNSWLITQQGQNNDSIASSKQVEVSPISYEDRTIHLDNAMQVLRKKKISNGIYYDFHLKVVIGKQKKLKQQSESSKKVL